MPLGHRRVLVHIFLKNFYTKILGWLCQIFINYVTNAIKSAEVSKAVQNLQKYFISLQKKNISENFDYYKVAIDVKASEATVKFKGISIFFFFAN